MDSSENDLRRRIVRSGVGFGEDVFGEIGGMFWKLWKLLVEENFSLRDERLLQVLQLPVHFLG